MIPEVMTAEQLARYLQLDEQTVYRKTRAGQIPAVRIGKILRFKKDVIDGWLRLAPLQWSPEKREELRSWAGYFAKIKGIEEENLQRAIHKRRYGS